MEEAEESVKREREREREREEENDAYLNK